MGEGVKVKEVCLMEHNSIHHATRGARPRGVGGTSRQNLRATQEDGGSAHREARNSHGGGSIPKDRPHAAPHAV